MPDSLTDAIAQASESTVTAMQAGSNKIVVRFSPWMMRHVLPAPTCPQVATPGVKCSILSQAEVLLGEFWDSSSGAVFAEEGDQERFWKLTRRFAENLVAMAEDGTRVRAVSCI